MKQPLNIRRTIEACRPSLEEFGIIHSVRENTGKRGRPSTAFYLNEEQALYVTIHCRTERAEAVKVQLVKVLTAWRRGQLVAVQPQMPNFNDSLALTRLLQAHVTAHIASEEGRAASSPSRST